MDVARAGSYLEVSSTSLKLSRRLTPVEYAWKISRKFVYRLVVYLLVENLESCFEITATV